jgi:translation initiation factor 3 subunit I
LSSLYLFTSHLLTSTSSLQILLGGGQDASSVTTTSAKAGGFESRFFHKIYAEEFGNVRGHFGPINSVAFHPDGRSFTTGGEDGYVRIHHLGEDYTSNKLGF